VIEQRALLVSDEALREAFCIATNGEEVVQKFARFIEAGCNRIHLRGHEPRRDAGGAPLCG
jgi:hypothetical protein